MNFDINKCMVTEGSIIGRLPANINSPNAYCAMKATKQSPGEKLKEPSTVNDLRMRNDFNFANYGRKGNNLLDLNAPSHYNGRRRADKNKNSYKLPSPQKTLPQIFTHSPKKTHDVDVDTELVFDDINVNWQANLNMQPVDEKVRRKQQQKAQQQHHHHHQQVAEKQFNNGKYYQQRQAPLHDDANDSDVLKVTKMIGQLPIAEYEGSPRRFGNLKIEQQLPILPKIIAKRGPGFPKRVSSNSATKQQTQQHQQQQVPAKQFKNPPTDKLLDINDDNDDDEENCVGAVGGQSKGITANNVNMHEISETRKVLEDFFKGNPQTHKTSSDFNASNISMQRAYENYRALECELQEADGEREKDDYIGQRLARLPPEDFFLFSNSPRKQPSEFTCSEKYYGGIFIDSMSRSSGDFADTELEANLQHYPRNFTFSPETTDYDSNCGDLDSSPNVINYGHETSKINMLEDVLSSGHASDTEINAMEELPSNHSTVKHNEEAIVDKSKYRVMNIMDAHSISDLVLEINVETDNKSYVNNIYNGNNVDNDDDAFNDSAYKTIDDFSNNKQCYKLVENINNKSSPQSRDGRWLPTTATHCDSIQIQEAMKEIRSALQRAKKQPEKLILCDDVVTETPDSPVWVPRKKDHDNSLKSNGSSKDNSTIEPKADDAAKEIEADEADADLETDRLLDNCADEEANFLNDKAIWSKMASDRSPTTSGLTLHTNTKYKPSHKRLTATIRHGEGTSITPTIKSPKKNDDINGDDADADDDDDDEDDEDDENIDDDEDDDYDDDVAAMTSPEKLQYSKSPSGSLKSIKDTVNNHKRKARNKEGLLDPIVLIEGVLFRARYLGSTQLVCEGQPTKSTRMMQAEEAVSRIKAPEGENQPSTEVDLFISTEKIMVLNTDLKEIMMDHALRTISYIADIGDLVVLMARRRFLPTVSACSENGENGAEQKDMSSSSGESKHSNRTPKMICHVFESDEAQFIAQSIGQAFQVAYMEFLKANGIEDHSFVKEMDYQEVLNSQEIFGDELQIFAKKELQKEVVVPKIKGEILGVVVVESGWGSMLPTVVIANLMSTGAAARCGQLNIGDQLIAINGLSLVGLPLSTCQNYIRNAKYQTAVKFTVVPCPPVVEVKIKRPNTKYQLGFSVQNGVICSLLRGGIAERGGVRVGHRIIEINNQSVVAVPHEKIVNLLATSVGEILMKTMPTSMFRLLTGQETPIYI